MKLLLRNTINRFIESAAIYWQITSLYFLFLIKQIKVSWLCKSSLTLGYNPVRMLFWNQVSYKHWCQSSAWLISTNKRENLGRLKIDISNTTYDWFVKYLSMMKPQKALSNIPSNVASVYSWVRNVTTISSKLPHCSWFLFYPLWSGCLSRHTQKRGK